MIEMSCPHCGHHLSIPDQFAGQAGKCRNCGGRIEVPTQDAAAPGAVEHAALPRLQSGSGFNDLGGMPEHTEGGVENFGAYGKAADALWDDPAQKDRTRPQADEPVRLPDVPAEILEKHRKNIARRNRSIAMFGGLLLVFVALIAMAYFMASNARDGAQDATPGAPPGATTPAIPGSP